MTKIRARLAVALAAALLAGIAWPGAADAAARGRHHGPRTPKPPVVAPVTPAPPTPAPAPAPGVVFQDDFNSLAAWNLYDSAGHDGQGRRSPAQIKANAGIATFTGTSSGTTGGMSLKGHDVRYGLVEVRLRAPAGAGQYHPVALLWGLGSGSGVNAATGEIDWVEFWNRPARNVNSFTLHYGDGSQMVGGDSGSLDGTQWHTYAVEWRAGFVEARIDGVAFYRVALTARTAPPGKMEVCLQLDWFPGERTTGGASSMEVDWLRISA